MIYLCYLPNSIFLHLDCPYGKKPMLLGSNDAFDTLSWIPAEESRKGPAKWTVAKNVILLSKYYLLTPPTLEALIIVQIAKNHY